MLREQRPLKFFKVPEESAKEFAREAKNHGLLYVPIRNKLHLGELEMVVFADDAAKVQRVLDIPWNAVCSENCLHGVERGERLERV